MSRLIIVSNRLPITIDTVAGGELIYHPSAGGLATGLNSLDDTMEKIWIGWPGKDIRSDWGREAIRKDLAEQDLVPVFLSKKEIRGYYEGFSNKTIWPHFHYFTQFTTYNEGYWDYYKAVNEKFAQVVIPIIQPGDIIWVHDYQLMLLPQLIRHSHPNVSIGFFLHIPFPSYEVFRILPWREDILHGILGADQIGFHTFGYMRHFLSAAYRITGHEHNVGLLSVGKRAVNVDVFPMGIDYEKYAFANADPQDEEVQKIGELAKQVKLIISIDRLDYTKGIPTRLKAFEQFLETYRDQHGKVSLLLIVVPSRSNVDQYQELKDQVDTLVGHINGKFGDFDWTPVRYFYRSLNFNELTALYTSAHIAMITPLRDGMNLVAKEFVASKENSKQGVLILSEMAGAANELTDALMVNPQDIKGMTTAMLRAIQMTPSEQERRLVNMQSKLKVYNVKHWANTFLNDLKQLNQQHQNISRMESKQLDAMYAHFRQAKNKLIILDYDGTLMDFQPDPQAVVPDDELLTMLRSLVSDTGTKLVVNSGRDKLTLQEWLGPLGIDMAAEHGVWIKRNGNWFVNPGLADGWKSEIRDVLENMVQRTPGSFIEEKDYSIAWHYRRIDKEFGEKRVREFRDVLLYLTANLDLQVLEGNKVVEIKNAGVNKGKATINWLQESDWDFIMAIGDDHTDEDTFKALPADAYTIKVGLENTAARYNVLSVKEVRQLLRRITEI
ncbi:MAG: bifunctional alpha,alpha-trehalose-phosphate synthase (UDP-forming)/trehalose-phosphatase [Saprospiraceae bacterium]|nr:bifunctional alpha,alpha-trehalose-phosphate synthase (UDP-forming)/trehalose-phosphatase [Saprospiraceae bacterium]